MHEKTPRSPVSSSGQRVGTERNRLRCGIDNPVAAGRDDNHLHSVLLLHTNTGFIRPNTGDRAPKCQNKRSMWVLNLIKNAWKNTTFSCKFFRTTRRQEAIYKYRPIYYRLIADINFLYRLSADKPTYRYIGRYGDISADICRYVYIARYVIGW